MPASLRWTQRPAAPQAFLNELPKDLHPLVKQVLWNRGVTDPEQVDRFLNVQWEQLHDPDKMRDMDRAVQRIREAIEAHERVAVYGDFDTDGVTGVTLLYQVLTDLGLDVIPYIPNRHTEGYGLNTAAIEELARKVSLLVTVDCGISNVDEVGRAQALGMDVIVLDHHLPPPILPNGFAVINPKRPGCHYPYKMLAGVGVAFKLVQALYRSGVRTSFKARQLLDIVTLGTVADVAPLDGENRVLVKFGLAELNRTRRPGLQALIDVAAVKGPVTCRSIGFALGPRLNAVGRLDDAIAAYTLLLCDDPGMAREMAANLDSYNVRRQELTTEVIERAKELAQTSGKLDRRILVLDGEGFPSGIVGLVASRLVETFGRPVLLLERGDELCRGSARSITGFSIIDALSECGDLFTKFGGHAMAAGFSIVPANLPALEERLGAIGMQKIDDDMLERKLQYDAELPLASQSMTLADQIGLLQPFGHGNDEPVWVTRDVRVVEARRMGKQAQHLKLRLHDGLGSAGEAVAWNMGDRAAEFPRNVRVDIAYTLELNEWQGRRTLQMKVKDLRLSQGATPL